jgi:hypothetical protein
VRIYHNYVRSKKTEEIKTEFTQVKKRDSTKFGRAVEIKHTTGKVILISG